MADVARRVVVSGRVQGVFFRDSTRRRADELGVRGWVCNRDDGRVEGHFEGDREAVDALVEFCRSGPGRADVDGVDVEEAAVGGASRFETR